MEIWKDIPGYEGLYKVSSLGRIKSLYNYRRGNILTPRLKRGYYTVGLRKNGTRLERVSKANKLNKAVLKFDLKGNFIERYHSMSEAARQNGVKSTSSIMDCCKGKTSQTKGFVYKYEEVVPCQ